MRKYLLVRTIESVILRWPILFWLLCYSP
jgi:hypothetical protein